MFCRFWNKYLPNRVRHSALLPSSVLTEIGQIGFYQVRIPTQIINFGIYKFNYHTADRNRVLLSGEFPDYIHAVSANVSIVYSPVMFISICMG